MLKTYFQQSDINVLLNTLALKNNERLSIEQLQNLQTKRFKKLLRHVLQSSRFYQSYYKKHGINLDNMKHVSVTDLPPISKQMMMDHYDDLVCDRFLKKEKYRRILESVRKPKEKYRNIYTVIHTSGSCGTLSLFVYGPEDWAVIKSLVVARVIKPVPHFYRRIKVSFIGATDGHYAGVSLASECHDFMAVFCLSPLIVRWKLLIKGQCFLSRCAERLLLGIHLLSQEQLKGNLTIRPERIICTSDPLTPRDAEY